MKPFAIYVIAFFSMALMLIEAKTWKQMLNEQLEKERQDKKIEMIKQEADFMLKKGVGVGVDVNVAMSFGFDKLKQDMQIKKISETDLLYTPSLYVEWNGINDITLFFGMTYYKLNL